MTSLFERLKSDCADDWQSYTHHPFVEQLGNGSLPLPVFQDYLVQDCLFLIQFARAYALSVYKSRSLSEMKAGLDGLKAIMDVEMDLHVRMCDRWGVSTLDLEQVPEKTQTIAYTRFVLEAGSSGDLLDLYVALAPCMIGYGEIGARLFKQTVPDNVYAEWIGEYASVPYQQLVLDTVANLDQLAAVMMTEARYPQLKKLFGSATRLEANFWQMGLDTAGQ